MKNSANEFAQHNNENLKMYCKTSKNRNSLDFIDSDKENQKENCNLMKKNDNRIIQKAHAVKIMNFVDTIDEIRFISLKQAYLKIKEGSKYHQISKLHLNPIIQIVNSLKNHYQKKILIFAFSTIKLFFWRKNRETKEFEKQIKGKTMKFMQKIEFFSQSLCQYSFMKLKKNFDTQAIRTFKNLFIKNTLLKIFKENNNLKELCFKKIKCYNDCKQKKAKCCKKIFNFVKNQIFLNKRLALEEVIHQHIKRQKCSEFHKFMILILLKLTCNTKKRCFAEFRNRVFTNAKIKTLQIENEKISLMMNFIAKEIVIKIQTLIQRTKTTAFKSLAAKSKKPKIEKKNEKHRENMLILILVVKIFEKCITKKKLLIFK